MFTLDMLCTKLSFVCICFVSFCFMCAVLDMFSVFLVHVDASYVVYKTELCLCVLLCFEILLSGCLCLACCVQNWGVFVHKCCCVVNFCLVCFYAWYVLLVFLWCVFLLDMLCEKLSCYCMCCCVVNFSLVCVCTWSVPFVLLWCLFMLDMLCTKLSSVFVFVVMLWTFARCVFMLDMFLYLWCVFLLDYVV